MQRPCRNSCIAPPSLSKIVYKLAQQELVTITKDGRIKHIYITDKGRELVPEILQIFNETREKFMEMNQDYNLSGFIKDVNYLREKSSKQRFNSCFLFLKLAKIM